MLRVAGAYVLDGLASPPRLTIDKPERNVVQTGTLEVTAEAPMLDASTELLKRGCVQPTLLPLRAAFEASVYIDFILQTRTDRRAKVYHLWNARRALRWAKRMRQGTPERRQDQREFRKIWNVTIKDSGALDDQDTVKAEVARLEAGLQSPKYRAWNNRFTKQRGKGPRDPDWYQVLFKKRVSFWALCQKVARIPEYRLIYELGSEATHSSQLDAHIRLDKNRMIMLPLRDPSDFGMIVQLLVTEALHTYLAVLGEYRPAERERFATKHIEEWRPIFGKSIRVVPKPVFKNI
jgi:hypothetical protein